MNYYQSILITTLCLIPLNATVYENAEDKRNSRWKVVSKGFSESIDNVYDRKKVSRIIHFQGNGTKSLYKLENKVKKYKKKEYWLTWEMNYSEDFVIIVALKTRRGKRYLIYTPGINSSYMQYGLGLNSQNGKWQKYKRNLQKDLKYYDNRNEVISIKSFVIKGSGSIDNIETISDNKFKKVYRQTSNNGKSSLPKITIKGQNPLHLKLGEYYNEPGVSALDTNDGELNVVCIENIDTSRDGEYMVMYMATNTKGNMAVDRRLVKVGRGKKELLVNNEEELKERALVDKRLEETEAWEQALELKEQTYRERINNFAEI